MIDLRSDTVTRPTDAMRAAMHAAELGDDVYGEDPTVNRLEARVAELLGKEAALFVPSGSMSNQIAIKAHTQPGDELICEEFCHIYNWEAGGPAFLSGVTSRTVRAPGGILDVDMLRDKARPVNDHMVRSRLVCLENTHNHGGGTIFPLAKVRAISQWARGAGLLMHLDGARLWNAIVATGTPAKTWAAEFDSVSVCFSKGLGAPVGSALAGTAEFIVRSRKFRKIFGGAMRQAGVLAAAALYALEHHIDRLADDHAHALILDQAIRSVPGLKPRSPETQSNLVWFDIDPSFGTAGELAGRLKARGVLVGQGGPQTLRVCTHLDVSRADAETSAAAIRACGAPR